MVLSTWIIRLLFVIPLVGACVFLWPSDGYRFGISTFVALIPFVIGVACVGFGSAMWFDIYFMLVLKLRILSALTVETFEVQEAEEHDVARRDSEGRIKTRTCHSVVFKYEVDGQPYWASYDSTETNLPEIFQSPSSAYDWAIQVSATKNEQGDTSAFIAAKPSAEAQITGAPYLLCLKGNNKRHYFGVTRPKTSCCQSMLACFCKVLCAVLIVGVLVGIAGLTLFFGLAMFTQTDRPSLEIYITIAVLYATWEFLGVACLFWYGYREASTEAPLSRYDDEELDSDAESADVFSKTG